MGQTKKQTAADNSALTHTTQGHNLNDAHGDLKAAEPCNLSQCRQTPKPKLSLSWNPAQLLLLGAGHRLPAWQYKREVA